MWSSSDCGRSRRQDLGWPHLLLLAAACFWVGSSSDMSPVMVAVDCSDLWFCHFAALSPPSLCLLLAFPLFLQPCQVATYKLLKTLLMPWLKAADWALPMPSLPPLSDASPAYRLGSKLPLSDLSLQAALCQCSFLILSWTANPACSMFCHHKPAVLDATTDLTVPNHRHVCAIYSL